MGFADRWHERRKRAPARVLLACHCRHPVDGYPLGGDDVHDALVEHPELAEHREHRGGDVCHRFALVTRP